MEIDELQDIIEATGAGAFGSLESDDTGQVVLRTETVKTAEVSGAVRLYFDGKRNQVMTGRRFEPMGQLFLRVGVVYKIITNVRFKESLHNLMYTVNLSNDAQDVMALIGLPTTESDGHISFKVMPFRRLEMDKMTSVASMYVYQSESFKRVTPAPRKKKVADETHVSSEHSDASKT